MNSPDKCSICIISLSKSTSAFVAKKLDLNSFQVTKFDEYKHESPPRGIDIFIVDAVFFEDNLLQKTRLLSNNPSALILGVVSKRNASSLLDGIVDWETTFDDLEHGIQDCQRARRILNSRCGKAALFEGLLTMTRKSKHEMANALSIAMASAGRLGKKPEIAENEFYVQLVAANERLAKSLEDLAELQENFSDKAKKTNPQV